MPWCFAKINSRLAEIYFRDGPRGPRIWGHCYVEKKDYKTKKEHKWIEGDMTKFVFVYRKGKYKRIISRSVTRF